MAHDKVNKEIELKIINIAMQRRAPNKCYSTTCAYHSHQWRRLLGEYECEEFWSKLGKSSLGNQLQTLMRVNFSTTNDASLCEPSDAEIIANMRDHLIETKSAVLGLCLSSLKNGVVMEKDDSK